MSYPEDADAVSVLRMLLASCERLQFEMGGTPASKNCTGLLDKWDDRLPTIFYLERNMGWAREVLARVSDGIPMGHSGDFDAS